MKQCRNNNIDNEHSNILIIIYIQILYIFIDISWLLFFNIVSFGLFGVTPVAAFTNAVWSFSPQLNFYFFHWLRTPPNNPNSFLSPHWQEEVNWEVFWWDIARIDT